MNPGMDYASLGIEPPDPDEHPAIDAGRWALAWKMAKILKRNGVPPTRVATYTDAQWLLLANQVPRKSKRTQPLSPRTKLITLGYIRRSPAGTS